MTMIEKVADVLMKYDWDMSLIEAKIVAKAAIEAMGEPSDEMIKVYVDYDGIFGGGLYCYNLMIDAALKED